MCEICGKPDNGHSPFCNQHVGGWATSPERAQVEWTSMTSYNECVDAYVTRFNAENAVATTPQNGKLPELRDEA